MVYDGEEVYELDMVCGDVVDVDGFGGIGGIGCGDGVEYCGRCMWCLGMSDRDFM